MAVAAATSPALAHGRARSATSAAPPRSARRSTGSSTRARSSRPRVSEPGQDLTRPVHAPRRAPSRAGGSTGRKIFCTMSPAATVLYTAVSFADDDGGERYGYARVPAGAARRRDPRRLGRARHARVRQPLGDLRRASSSPRPRCAAASRSATPTAYMDRNLTAGLFHAAASLGIAEAAHEHRHPAARRPRASTPASQIARRGERDRPRRRPRRRSRAPPSWTKQHLDAGDGGPRGRVFAEVQAAKTFINEAAVRVVDRALALVRRRRLPNGHPLARAVPRRPGRRVHAPARRQPRLRLRRRGRPRARAVRALRVPTCTRCDPLRVHVSILGPLLVEHDGAPREIAGGRLQALLARLAIDAGRPVSHGALADAVWEGDPPRDVQHALQSLVSRLRRALGDSGAHRPGGGRLPAGADARLRRRAAVRAARARGRGRASRG